MCYHCNERPFKTSSLTGIVEHCISIHGNIELKYRTLISDQEDGKEKYLSKLHEGIVPDNLEEIGKRIEVRGELVYLLDERSKKKKLNTPIKLPDRRRRLCPAMRNTDLWME